MSLLALLASSSVGTPIDPDPAPVDPVGTTSTPYNAASALAIPTPDGTGQAVHPDVVDFANRITGHTWNGHRYWMGFTPYLNSNDDLENPCIAYSDNGINWTAPPGVNPIDPAPTNPALNSDTDLAYDPDTGRVWIYWREAQGPDGEVIFGSWSTDSTTWSAPVTMFSVTGNGIRALSPAIVRVGANDWRMWTIGYTGVDGDYTSPIHAVRTATSPAGPWSAPTINTLTGLTVGAKPWHVDVVKDAATGKLHMLLDARGEWGLWAFTSTDGITWTAVGSGPFLTSDGAIPGAWDKGMPYRATMQLETNGQVYAVWYSAYEGTAGWGIGRTRVPRTVWTAIT